MRIAVIGGGLTGLTCAYYLVRRGFRPIVFESRPKLGPRVSEEPGAWSLDPFPITLLRSDTAACGLISDLGLTAQLQWQSTPSGVFTNGATHSLTGWRDLLRFAPLTWAQRLRAAGSAYASMRLRNYARPLDAVHAREWFSRTQGSEMYRALWRPALAARFGSDCVDEMPAYVAWQFLREELLGVAQVSGLLRGGMATLYDALARAIQDGGGELHLDTRVHSIQGDERRVDVEMGHGHVEVDAAIASVKLPGLAEITRGELAACLAGHSASPRMQVISALRVWLRGASPLQGYYRMLMFEPTTVFPVVLDASTWLSDVERGDRCLIYLLRTASASSPELPRDREAERRCALDTLRCFDPAIEASQVEETRLAQWRSPEPVWPIDALRHPIPNRLAKSPLYVCTAAQAYPRGATPEAAVMVARDCVGRVVRELQLR